jgi:hypothetical protein
VTLKLAPGLSLPDDTVTQALGILAKRGAGKSNAGAVLAEEMHKAGLQFDAVDPVGAWWGLRSSADGRGPGLPIPVLGGYHGDVPLEPGAGHLIADLVVQERLSAVIDVSAFGENEKKRFLADFGERLFNEKGKPGHEEPLHLFLEEAHDYAPQGGERKGDRGRCLGAFQRIVSQGRGRGLGSTMITQRSAALNKHLLTQIDTLIVLRTTSPQDRKAIAGWVASQDLDEELLESLPGLKSGEAWVWSPEALELVKRVQIRRRATFDSGATPKIGAKRRAPKTVADVDLDKLHARMQETIARAEAEDPKLLTKRIRQLEAELRRGADSKNPKDSQPQIVEVEVEVPVLTPDVEKAMRALSDGLVERIERVGLELRHSGDELVSVATEIRETAGEVLELGLPVRPIEAPRRAAPPRRPPPVSPPRTREQKRNREPDIPLTAPHDGEMTGPERKVLNAIAWWQGVGFPQPSKVQVAFIAGYRVSKRVGGHYGNTLGSLKGAGLIFYPTPGQVDLTDEGRLLAQSPAIERSISGLQNAVFERLNGPERKVLEVLIEVYPDALSKQELGARAGYEVGERVGGHFGNILGSLKGLQLIDYPTPGVAVARPVLFLE